MSNVIFFPEEVELKFRNDCQSRIKKLAKENDKLLKSMKNNPSKLIDKSFVRERSDHYKSFEIGDASITIFVA